MKLSDKEIDALRLYAKSLGVTSETTTAEDLLQFVTKSRPHIEEELGEVTRDFITEESRGHNAVGFIDEARQPALDAGTERIRQTLNKIGKAEKVLENGDARIQQEIDEGSARLKNLFKEKGW